VIKERQGELPARREAGCAAYMVSSAILNEAVVTNKWEVRKGACSRLSADSYIDVCLNLTRGDKMEPRVPGVF